MKGNLYSITNINFHNRPKCITVYAASLYFDNGMLVCEQYVSDGDNPLDEPTLKESILKAVNKRIPETAGAKVLGISYGFVVLDMKEMVADGKEILVTDGSGSVPGTDESVLHSDKANTPGTE